NAANSVGLLAADVTAGGFGYTNAGGLTIGTAFLFPPGSILGTIQSGVTAAADIGIHTNAGNLAVAGNVTSTGGGAALVAANALTIGANVNVGTHNLLLGSSGSVYTNTGTIIADGLVVQVNNATSDVAVSGTFSRIAAVITGAANVGFSYISSGVG